MKWKHFRRCWPFVRGIHRSTVNSPHKDQWRGAMMFSLICARINGWVNTRKAGDLRHHCTHFDVIVMSRQLTYWGLNKTPDILKCLCLKEHFCILIQISLQLFRHLSMENNSSNASVPNRRQVLILANIDPVHYSNQPWFYSLMHIYTQDRNALTFHNIDLIVW